MLDAPHRNEEVNGDLVESGSACWISVPRCGRVALLVLISFLGLGHQRLLSFDLHGCTVVMLCAYGLNRSVKAYAFDGLSLVDATPRVGAGLFFIVDSHHRRYAGTPFERSPAPTS